MNGGEIVSAKNQKAKISAKKLFKFAGIMILFIYAAFILVKQQFWLSYFKLRNLITRFSNFDQIRDFNHKVW